MATSAIHAMMEDQSEVLGTNAKVARTLIYAIPASIIGATNIK